MSLPHYSLNISIFKRYLFVERQNESSRWFQWKRQKLEANEQITLRSGRFQTIEQYRSDKSWGQQQDSAAVSNFWHNLNFMMMGVPAEKRNSISQARREISVHLKYVSLFWINTTHYKIFWKHLMWIVDSMIFKYKRQAIASSTDVQTVFCVSWTEIHWSVIK